jgi:hypothetical protein
MPAYDCKTIPLTKLIPTPNGYLQPLCNKCKSKDCENPIEQKIISVLGVPKKMRVYVLPHSINIVVDCPNGYVE